MNILRFWPERFIALGTDRSYPVEGDTIVKGECYGSLRERNETELVHYRVNDDELDCPQCGGFAAIWVDSLVRWELHPDRCIK